MHIDKDNYRDILYLDRQGKYQNQPQRVTLPKV